MEREKFQEQIKDIAKINDMSEKDAWSIILRLKDEERINRYIDLSTRYYNELHRRQKVYRFGDIEKENLRILEIQLEALWKEVC